MSGKTAVQRMLMEAMTAASEFIDENKRKDFLIIGGAALARYGSLRKKTTLTSPSRPRH
jgi:hypothetical protein